MDTAAVDLLPFLSPQQVADQLGRAYAPLIFDARKTPAFDAASRVIPCALRLLPDDVSGIVSRLTRERRVVVYCVHGHAVSQGAARSLRDGGIHACYLEGGITAWEQAGLPTIAKLPECGLPAAPGRASRWSTRERPKIDRIACPWPIRRFIDPTAEFLYVPAGQVIKVGQAQHAIPYDVPDVRFSHRGAAGELCSFDAFIAHFGLNDPACTTSRASCAEPTPASPHSLRNRRVTVGFIGYLIAGLPGACVAALATFLPCYLFTIIPAPYFKKYGKLPGIIAFVDGVTAAAIGAITGAVIVLAKRSLFDIPTVLLAIATVLLLLKFKKLQEPVIVAGAAALGLVVYPLLHG